MYLAKDKVSKICRQIQKNSKKPGTKRARPTSERKSSEKKRRMAPVSAKTAAVAEPTISNDAQSLDRSTNMANLSCTFGNGVSCISTAFFTGNTFDKYALAYCGSSSSAAAGNVVLPVELKYPPGSDASDTGDESSVGQFLGDSPVEDGVFDPETFEW